MNCDVIVVNGEYPSAHTSLIFMFGLRYFLASNTSRSSCLVGRRRLVASLYERGPSFFGWVSALFRYTAAGIRKIRRC